MGIKGVVFVGVVALIVGAEVEHLHTRHPSLAAEPSSHNKVNPDWYNSGGSVSFRHVGDQWVANGEDECTGHDAEVIAGNPNYYPEVCKPTPDDATAADVWYAKRHPGWNAEASYRAAEARADRWRKRHPGWNAETLQETLETPEMPASASPDDDQPESEDLFVFMTTNALTAATDINHEEATLLAKHEFVRCRAMGFSTEVQMNDCVLHHPDAALAALRPASSF